MSGSIRIKNLFIVLVIILTAGFSSAQEVREIPFYHDNPEWQQVFQGLGELSAKEIQIRTLPQEFTTYEYKSRIQVDVLTPRAPAVFKWWFGFQARALLNEGLVTDLSGIWDQAADSYDPGIREALTHNGVTYGFPLHASYWFWYYNKPLFEKHNLTLPETWPEFMAQLAYFKSKGIAAIGTSVGTSDGNQRWMPFIIFQEILYRIDAVFYNDLMNGRAHWTDPPVMETMRLWRKLVEENYFCNQTATFVDDFPRLFREGKLAYIPLGEWYGGILQRQNLVSGKDYGIYIPPPITPAGQGAIVIEISPLIVSKNFPDQAAAKQWMQWYSTSEEAANFLWRHAKLRGNRHVNLEMIQKDDPALVDAMARIKAYPTKLIRFWEATPNEIVEQAVNAFNKMMVAPEDYETLLQGIEAKAREVWPQYHVDY